MKKIKTLKDNILQKPIPRYKFQPELTPKLDALDEAFTQNILNEIVLWKVNRYALFDNDTIKLLNIIEKSSRIIDIVLTKKILCHLLKIKGVKIAIASTILRFKNPYIYQIIDQRVYRIIYGYDMPRKSKIEDSIEQYLMYLIKLQEICKKHKLDFTESDRVLYVLDKKVNSGIPIKY